MRDCLQIVLNGQERSYKTHDYGCWQSRNTSVLKFLKKAMDTHFDWDCLGDRSITVLLFSTDMPDVADVNQVYNQFGKDVCIMYMCNHKDIALKSFPCHIFGGWPEAHIASCDEMAQAISQAGLIPPIDHHLFWIGAMTHSNRNVLCQIAKNHPDLIDARNFHWNQKAGFVSLPDHTKYKYLIDIEGNGYSGRLKLLFWSRRLVFVQDRPLWDHATCQLVPWVHYVPVRRDLGDLVEKIKWADDHPDEVQKIIANAHVFAEQHITEAAATRHMADLLQDVCRHHGSRS